MMAALTTAICEEWIRERVGLNHENLEDVKSLALPGTYHEKITSLGSALKKFTRIKNLDLSRNSLDSIKGLENCTLLENVNLYYNNLNTLEDLSPLRLNSKITNLDLRLNPVARTEADYRLFVVNILPSLKILDDRPVRDSEREAATAHFGPAKQDENTAPGTERPFVAASSSSKNRLIPSGIMGATTMDADDHAVLNLLAKSEAQPTQLSGSAVTAPKFEDYQLNELKALGHTELAGLDAGSQGSAPHSEDLDNKTTYYQSKYPNIPAHRLSEITANDLAKQEVDAYTSYKGQGHFTPNPDLVAPEHNSEPHSDKSRVSSGNDGSQAMSGSNTVLHNLLDLVDKYWNGSKSLHDNKKFMKLATELQAQMSAESTAALHSQVQHLRTENSELLKTVHANEGLKKVKVRLEQADTEMEKLKAHITDLQEENTRLRLSLHTQPAHSSPSTRPAGSSHEVEELKHENYQLQFKLKQYSQMSELARMLQESHKSLVQTNDHLLREIEEMRAKPESRHKLNGH